MVTVSRKLKVLIVVNFFLLISLMGLIFNMNNVVAQNGGDSLLIPTNFTLLELGENIGNKESIRSIDLEVPTSSWNLNEIQLNFTNIKLGQEIKTIEDEPYGTYTIYRKNSQFRVQGYGIQINLTEPTILYGVELFGSKLPGTNESIQVQIRGFDNVNNKPNNTIYTSTVLNMSEHSEWHRQTFLAKGSYYLVLNGSNIVDVNTKYFWAYNHIDPADPNLYSSEFIDDWSIGVKNTTLLYKLIQKVDRSFFPQEINMTVNINGDSYDVIDGASSGSGNIIATNLSHNVSGPNLYIPMVINSSIELDFNLNYSIKMSKALKCESSVTIDENPNNSWSITPQLFREFSNYCVKLFFPEDWFDLVVKRDSVDINSQIQVDSIDHFIIIPNHTILDGVDWLITANSTRVSFDLDVDRTEFLVGQDLKFSILEPVLNGNYTFVLTDPFDDVIYTDNKTIPSDSYIFTFSLPQTAIDGEYKAYIYWFNGTDTGLTTQVFMITIPPTIDWFMVTSIIIIIGLTSTVSASSYVLIRKNKKKRVARKEEIYDKCLDILNLDYVLIIEKNSSLNVYDHVYTEKKMNTVLLSGFLEAIRTFGIELTGSKDHSQIIKLDYNNSKILMAEFKNFRLILIMKELPSVSFYDSISALSLEIEEKYGSYLETFKGDLKPFRTIEELIKKHLGTAFLYPLKVVGIDKTKISTSEKTMINSALNLMKMNKKEYCFTTQLMQDKGYNSKDIETIFSLIDKNVFQPLD